MREFDDLVEIIARLRGPGGCPWDGEQTHETLKPYLLEECYEALEALDSGDAEALCGELGDVLLEITLHAQLGAEAGSFDISDVCQRISDKLVYRHPHVFGNVHVEDSDEVLANWEQLKRQERGDDPRTSVLDGIPRTLPALKRSTEVQKRASKVGFDWDEISGPVAKVAEELAELEEARAACDPEAIAQELGDVLFAVVNMARFLAVDSEDALRMTCDRFAERFRQMESEAVAAGRCVADMTLEELDELWEAIKRRRQRAAGSLPEEHRSHREEADGEEGV